MTWTLNLLLKTGLVICLIALVYLCEGGILPLTPAKITWALSGAGLLAPLLRPWLVRRSVSAPVPLADATRSFDAGGVWFVPVIEADEGVARLKVYFQNCHARPCSVEIRISADTLIHFDCPAGGCGVVRARLTRAAVARRVVHGSVYAIATYRGGRGEPLCYNGGSLVPPPLLAALLDWFDPWNEISLPLPADLPADTETPTRVEILGTADQPAPARPTDELGKPNGKPGRASAQPQRR